MRIIEQQSSSSPTSHRNATNLNTSKTEGSPREVNLLEAMNTAMRERLGELIDEKSVQMFDNDQSRKIYAIISKKMNEIEELKAKN